MNVVGRARMIHQVHEPQGSLAIGEWILCHLLPSLFSIGHQGTRASIKRISRPVSLPHKDEVGGSLPAELDAPSAFSLKVVAVGEKLGFGPGEGRLMLVWTSHFHEDRPQRTGGQHGGGAIEDLFLITVDVE